MNHNDLNDLSDDDLAFMRRTRTALRASETLNYVEAAKLSAARARVRALMTERRSHLDWAWLLAPVTAVALLAMFGLQLGPASVSEPAPGAVAATAIDVNVTSSEALMWASDEAGPDFYRDLAFYEWLQSRSPTEPNA